MSKGDKKDDGTSFFSGYSDVIKNLREEGVKCSRLFNSSCIKCKAVHEEMVRIGAFIMCEACWKTEFNVDVIPTGSKLYEETYHKWLKIYQEQ